MNISKKTKKKSTLKNKNPSNKKNKSSSSEKINIMTWNILARITTRYRWKIHNFLENLSEHIEQTLNRYQLILNEIKKHKQDIYCLQEVDYNFVYYIKKHLDKKYSIFFEPNSDNSKYKKNNLYGTAIIWDKTRFKSKKKMAIDINNKKLKKYTQKNSTVILFFDKKTKKQFNCVSIHLSGTNKEERYLLIDETFKKLDKKYPIIICGDFNCKYNITNCINEHKQLKNLNTFKYKKTDYSTCIFDYDNKFPKALIDGIFYTDTINLIKHNIGKKKSCKNPIYKKNSNNYSDTASGSDHFWLKGTFQII